MAKLSSTDIYGDLYVDGIISGILSGSVSNNLKIQLNGGTTEGTNQFTFNGSAAKTINITPSGIGALPLSGGTLTGRMLIGSSVSSTDASAPTQLAYGLLSSYGNLKLLADTDNSNSGEYVHIASANGLTPGVDKGIVVYSTYANCFGAKISTEGHAHNNISSRGNVTCETGANVRPAVAGLSMAQAYSNGYPTSYGNVISLRGAGDGQILVGWSGTSGAHAPMYVRSRRDTTDADWSGWAQVYTSANPQTTMNGLTLWKGTQAEYNAISSKSSTTLYFITG